MTKGYDLEHTDATQQARFKSLAQEEQMMEIWLNTRETNGHVAAAVRDIHELKEARHEDLLWRAKELQPWMVSVDRRFLIASTVVGVAVFLLPLVMSALGLLEINLK